MTSQSLIVIALAAICMGALAYALLYERIAAEAERERRIGAIRTTPARRNGKTAPTEKNNRRGKVQSAIADIERQQKSAGKVTLKRRLQQAGLDWSVSVYVMASAICGLVLTALAVLSGANVLVVILVGVIGFALLPKLYVNRRRKKRLEAFLSELPNAVDVIVRGVKAGLPLNDCLHIVAKEAAEPVRSEFAKVVESMSAGIPVTQALEKMYHRVPASETNFLAIVIGIQAKSGGSMSEALGNLSGMLRDRKKMKGKIQAMSMEAKASAAVIGSLPIVVMGLVFLTAQDYIMTLFLEPMGNLLLAGAVLWMGIGVVVMKNMINFDF